MSSKPRNGRPTTARPPAKPKRQVREQPSGDQPALHHHAGPQLSEAEQQERRPTGAHRSGFACFVGRPNAGKSTLTNALVGEKVAITSSRPQTTRHTIRGIVSRPEAQLVLVDTPGLHRPRTCSGNG